MTSFNTDSDIKRIIMEEEFGKYALPGWTIGFNKAKQIAGICNHTKKKICISRGFFEKSTFDELKDTVLHEVAHMLVGSEHGHNKIWKQKAIEIGCSGERCHDVDFSQPNYKILCVGCNKELGTCFKKIKCDNKRSKCCSQKITLTKYM